MSIRGGMVAVTPMPGDEIGLRRFRENIELVYRLLSGETPEHRPPPDAPSRRP